MIIVPTNTPKASGGDPYYGNVKALLTGEGSHGSNVIVDRSPLAANWIAHGSLAVSTTQSKWGGSSLLFDGGGYMTPSAPSSEFDMSGDFTIELHAWRNFGSGWIVDFSPGGGFNFNFNGNIIYVIPPGSGTTQQITTAVTNGAWHHIAVSRNSGVFRGFFNGVLGLTYTAPAPVTAAANRPIVGADGANPSYEPARLYSYIDDLRITVGVGRYTDNFVPPTGPFPTS